MSLDMVSSVVGQEETRDLFWWETTTDVTTESQTGWFVPSCSTSAVDTIPPPSSQLLYPGLHSKTPSQGCSSQMKGEHFQLKGEHF
jgi:hypothetical protein